MIKKIIILATLLTLGLLLVIYKFWILDFTRIIDKNIEIASKTKSYLYLSEVTPFEWDKAFFIEDPYIGGEALDKIVGVKCNLKRTDTETVRRIIFIKAEIFVHDYKYQWTDIVFKACVRAEADVSEACSTVQAACSRGQAAAIYHLS